MAQINRLANILVAIDGSEQSMRAADLAISIASKYNSQVTALHVISLNFGAYNSPWFVDAETLQALSEKTKTEADQWLKEVEKKGQAQGVKVHIRIEETVKSVAAAIVEFADSDKVDIIVIGSRGRSGFKRLLLGSVATDVVTYATCPVTVVR
jgi:nucleotide-binding universal stress UspA family protein